MSQTRRLVLGLSIGLVGGVTFWLLSLPLPWMLGALFATMIAGVARVPVRGPDRIRPLLVAVIGVMLGARFQPELLDRVAVWTGTLSLLLLYLVAVGAVVVPYHRFVGRMDWPTAYFAGMPGGLAEIVEIGEANGAKVRPVVLAHSLRIVLTISAIAIWYRVVQGLQVGAATAGMQGWPAWDEALILLAAAVGGSLLGRWLRLPAPTFLGPMFVSAVLHVTAVSEIAPPMMLVNLAQLLLGTVLGCRFYGVSPRELRDAGALALGATALTMALAFAFARAMQAVAGVPADQAMLALAPGGLTEMGLIALAIHADVAFVALHHVVRILAIIVAAPVVFRLLRRTSGRS